MDQQDLARNIARAFDVPPWLMDPAISAPRFRRLRWMLRRVWPI